MNEQFDVTQMIENAGGKIEKVYGPLPDGSGFMIGSFPLPEDHWIYNTNTDSPNISINIKSENEIIIITRKEFEQALKEAGKYAICTATMNGKEMDFDPDALLQNLFIGMFGYHKNIEASS